VTKREGEREKKGEQSLSQSSHTWPYEYVHTRRIRNLSTTHISITIETRQQVANNIL